jgi:hypothetical protein
MPRGRPKKVRVEEVAAQIPEIAPETIIEQSNAIERDAELFEDLDEPDDAVMLRPDDGIPALDSDLTPPEKMEFIRLLNTFMPLADRARQLVKLALYTDTKRAAVGLRAIQEINALTGMHKDVVGETAPMFQLPADTSVNISISKVIK